MPQVLPIDVTAIVSVILGMLVVLIPVAGATARFALKPLVESLSNLMASREVTDGLRITERRVALLEQQVESLEQLTRRLQEERDFDRELASGPRAGELPQAGGSGPSASGVSRTSPPAGG